MSPLRILAAATAIELCLLTALLAVLGIGGAWNGWLDLVNCGAPILLPVAAAAAWAARTVLDRGSFRTVCVGLALFAVLFNAVLIGPEFLRLGGEIRPHGGRSYRVVTANVFRDNNSPFHAALDVTSRGADALLLQETDGGIQRAAKTIALSYPYATDCPRAAVSIRVKTPILAQGCGLQTSGGGERPDEWLDFVWLRTLAPDGRPITLATAHLGRPYPPGRQAGERQALAQALARLPKDDMILAGDFNTPPWNFAMRDQDRLFAPLRRRTMFWPTWPARLNLLSRPWGLPILPIDHIYTGAQWGAARLTRFRTTGSDHFAIQADLALAR